MKVTTLALLALAFVAAAPSLVSCKGSSTNNKSKLRGSQTRDAASGAEEDDRANGEKEDFSSLWKEEELAALLDADEMDVALQKVLDAYRKVEEQVEHHRRLLSTEGEEDEEQSSTSSGESDDNRDGENIDDQDDENDDDEKWAEMPASMQSALLVLGYTKDTWDSGSYVPPSFHKKWKDLDAKQKAAAVTVGFSSDTWEADAVEAAQEERSRDGDSNETEVSTSSPSLNSSTTSPSPGTISNISTIEEEGEAVDSFVTTAEEDVVILIEDDDRFSNDSDWDVDIVWFENVTEVGEFKLLPEDYKDDRTEFDLLFYTASDFTNPYDPDKIDFDPDIEYNLVVFDKDKAKQSNVDFLLHKDFGWDDINAYEWDNTTTVDFDSVMGNNCSANDGECPEYLIAFFDDGDCFDDDGEVLPECLEEDIDSDDEDVWNETHVDQDEFWNNPDAMDEVEITEGHQKLENNSDGYWTKNFDGKWRAPTEEELSYLLVEQVHQDSGEGKTVTAPQVIEQVLVKYIQSAPKEMVDTQEKKNGLVEEFMKLVKPNSTEMQLTQYAILRANNQSICNLPGQCRDKKHMISIKDKVKDMLNDYLQASTLPDMSAIYNNLQDEVGVDAAFVDKIIEASPKIKEFLNRKLNKVGRLVQRKDQSGLIKKVEEALKIIGNSSANSTNSTSHNETLAELGLSESDVSKALNLMGSTQAKKLLDEAAGPRDKVKKQVGNAYKKLHAEQKRYNHTYFEEVEDKDDKNQTSRRYLKFNRHPSKLSIDDHVKVIDDRIRRRRLTRRLFTKDTVDFEDRLNNHLDELQDHIRRLQLVCDEGESAAQCVADKLEETSDKLKQVRPKIKPALKKLSKFLDTLSNNQKLIDLAESAASKVMLAMTIAGAIPEVGVIFRAAKKIMKIPADILKSVESKAKLFQSSIGKVWKKSIGHVDDLMASFKSGKMYYVKQGAKFVAFAQEQGIITAVVNYVAGTKIVGDIGDIVSQIEKYVNVLVTGLTKLVEAFASTTFQAAISTIKTIMNAIEPVRLFFKPFEYLADLLTKSITIKPWFHLPYTVTNLGDVQCPYNYHGGTPGISGSTCWENDSDDWKWYHLSYDTMEVTCEYGGLTKNWNGFCNKRSYRRDMCGFGLHGFWPHMKCDKSGNPEYIWGGVLHMLSCRQKCISGYSGFGDTCYQDCPDGFTGHLEFYCSRTKERPQKQVPATCDGYPLAPNTHYSQWAGSCYQSCKDGDTEILHTCWAPMELKISVESVLDALKKILDFIMHLPILKQINEAIGWAVGKVLKPIIDKIKAGIKKALGIVDFPTLNLGDLPFDIFKNLDLSLPSLPDLPDLSELPKEIWNGIVKALPTLPGLPNFSGIDVFAMDIDSVLKRLSLGGLDEFVAPVTSVVGAIKDSTEYLEKLLEYTKCKQWSKVEIPVSNVFDLMGLPNVANANQTVQWCSAPDFSGANTAKRAELWYLYEDLLKPIRELMMGSEGSTDRRFLEEGSHPKDGIFLPVLEIELGSAKPFGLATGRGKGVAEDFVTFSLPAKKKTSKPTGAMGIHTKLSVKGVLQLGLLQSIDDGEWGYGIKVGAKHMYSAVPFVGQASLLEKAIDFGGGLTKAAFKETDEYKECKEDDAVEACDHIQEAMDHIKGLKPKDFCKLSAMKKRKSGKATKTTVVATKNDDCADYWWEQKKTVDDLIEEYDVGKSEGDLKDLDNSDQIQDQMVLKMDWLQALSSSGSRDHGANETETSRIGKKIVRLDWEAYPGQIDDIVVDETMSTVLETWYFSTEAKLGLALDDGLGLLLDVDPKPLFDTSNGTKSWEERIKDGYNGFSLGELPIQKLWPDDATHEERKSTDGVEGRLKEKLSKKEAVGIQFGFTVGSVFGQFSAPARKSRT